MVEVDEKFIPGWVVLFGSGETSPSGRKVFELVMRRLRVPPRVSLLETPAGFELNSDRVIGRIGEFLEHRLQNYQPKVQVIPARARGTAFSPDNPEITAPILEADMIFMGPGSPTYAIRQLRDSLAWQMILARHRLGANLVLASAATVAVSTWALPVYEIYKVGEDLHWKPGLDFFSLYGLPLVFIPHWNNQDGGEELDTSRCFMGQARFMQLMAMLPPELTVVGIDEKTALLMDVQAGTGRVAGLGGVTLIHTGHQHAQDDFPVQFKGSEVRHVAQQRKGHVHYFASGSEFSLEECCPLKIPDFSMGLSDEIWQQAIAVHQRRQAELDPANQAPGWRKAPAEVLSLVEARRAARENKDWVQADRLRQQVTALGWAIKDTPEGAVLERIEENTFQEK